jgi:hypothetical protein
MSESFVKKIVKCIEPINDEELINSNTYNLIAEGEMYKEASGFYFFKPTKHDMDDYTTNIKSITEKGSSKLFLNALLKAIIKPDPRISDNDFCHFMVNTFLAVNLVLDKDKDISSPNNDKTYYKYDTSYFKDFSVIKNCYNAGTISFFEIKKENSSNTIVCTKIIINDLHLTKHNKFSWELAKLFALKNAIYFFKFGFHNGVIHKTVEIASYLTEKYLDKNHQLYIFLNPHIKYANCTNQISTKIVLEHTNPFSKFDLTADSFKKLVCIGTNILKSKNQLNFDYVKTKHSDTINKYMLPITDLVKNFVLEYNIETNYIKRWYDSFKEFMMIGDFNINNFIKLLTIIIFRATFAHSYDHYELKELLPVFMKSNLYKIRIPFPIDLPFFGKHNQIEKRIDTFKRYTMVYSFNLSKNINITTYDYPKLKLNMPIFRENLQNVSDPKINLNKIACNIYE